MKKAGVIILATILMVTLMVIGSNAAEAPKSIIIGALVSMTGPDALTGQPSKHGYQLGADMINAKGGVYVKEYGKKIPSGTGVSGHGNKPGKGDWPGRGFEFAI